jgi:hypothetical protein
MTTQTRHQTPRSARADAEKLNRLYLIKNVSTLRATYQIRLLTFRAVSEGLKLIIRVPRGCRFESSLLKLIRDTGTVVLREDY